jgi:hypothetical protein
MKLKDFLTKVTENKKNRQLNTSFKRRQLEKCDISTGDLLNMEVDPRLKRLLFSE